MAEKNRTNYYPESQKKYAQANKERKSAAKRFIREDATIEELQELAAMIDEKLREMKDFY